MTGSGGGGRIGGGAEAASGAVVADWLLKRHHLVALLMLAVFLFPLCWIAQYNYPSGDDYAAFHQAHSLGTLQATKWWYLNWSGRYASFFVQSLFPQHATWLLAYKLIPVALLSAGFGCVFFFIKTFFGPDFTNRELFTIATCAYIVLISLTPDIATGFYWLPSGIQYVGAVFITLLILALYVKLESTTSVMMTVILLGTLVGLIACLAGLNEISALLLIGIIGFICCVQLLRFRRLPTLGLILLSSSVVFALLSFLAPGNALRAAQVHRESHVIKAQVSAIGLTLYLLFHLLSGTPLLLVSGLYLCFLEHQRGRLGHVFSLLGNLRWYWVLLYMLGGISVVNAILFTAGGIHLTERVENVYVYSVVVMWFVFITVVFANATGRQRRFSMPGWVVGVMTLFVLLFLVTGFRLQLRRHDFVPDTSRVQKAFTMVKTRSVYTNAYLDIFSGRAARYAWQNEQTTSRFRSAEGGCVEFLPLSYVPETLFIHVLYPWRWCPEEYLKTFGQLSP